MGVNNLGRSAVAKVIDEVYTEHAARRVRATVEAARYDRKLCRDAEARILVGAALAAAAVVVRGHIACTPEVGGVAARQPPRRERPAPESGSFGR